MNKVGTVEIRTKRLLLRRFKMEDAESAWRNYGGDPLVNRYISFAPCATRESTVEFLRMHELRYDRDPDFYGWAVTLYGEVIGSVGLFNVDHQTDSCEVGASLGSRWWGKGYTTEAVSALLAFAFGQMGAHRVYGSHHRDNLGSGRVMEKCGMQKEGVLRDGQKNRDGTFSDLLLYSILAGEWEASGRLESPVPAETVAPDQI